MRKHKRFLALPLAFAMSIATLSGVTTATATASTAPVGNGFTVTAGDLTFILKQIKIAERHSRQYRGVATPAEPAVPNPHPTTDPMYCSALLGPAADQIPDIITSYGLRTVDGECNNLKIDVPVGDSSGQQVGAADIPFPRLTTPSFRQAEPITPALPVGPLGSTSYAQKSGNVVDSQPRVISNLIVDQTSTNPAAVAAAAFPVRTQGNPGLHPCTTDPDLDAVPPTDGIPAGCVPKHQTLFIPNVTTDVGLSPPYNSLFTFFGQFFDHGVDQTVKSGSTVFVPLKADDPLRTLGPDGIAGTNCGTPTAKHCDEVPAGQAFMVLTRAQNQPGPDGVLGNSDDIQNANNTDSPWVDQSQTYTSHPAHQVLLREYDMVGEKPVTTGKLLGGIASDDPLTATCSTDAITPCYNDGNATTSSISTWASTKKQAAEKLGLRLTDADVTNIPMIAADPYGNYIPDATTGLPDFVTSTGLVSGDLANPTPVPANVLHFDTPFLTDIAHNADPSPQDSNGDGNPDLTPVPDSDTVASADFAKQAPGTYDDELLNDHFTCGDGRCNENIALSSIHQIFHSEHDRLVDDITSTLAAYPALQADFSDAPAGATFGLGGRLFQAARFVTEMEYQHLVFEEFARKVQPAVRPFHVYSPDINPAIEAEFAHAVYRFGHSMLDDDVARINVDATGKQKKINTLPLLTAFLNPPEYFNSGDPGTPLTPEAAAGSVVMGSSDQAGNELDEFVTETLRNNLLGLPIDLATINLTRAREAGVPPLNSVRRQIHAQTNDAALAPYTDWSDFGQHLKHPESLVNFVAAYGAHPTIVNATGNSGPDGIAGNADDVTLVAAKRAAARAIVDPLVTDVPPADAAAFMFGTDGTDPATCPTGCNWSSTANGVTTTGLDNVDLWVGGLAEVTNLFGGLLGSTFNYVFQNQLEDLQDGDRLYYLARTPGMNLRTQLEGNSFSELIGRNTTGTNALKADAFATADCKFQLGSITFPGTVAGSPNTPAGKLITGAGSVNDDPATDCDENQLLLRKPDGTFQYRAINNIDPPGINGQSVYNGGTSTTANRVFGGNDNDTFWGGPGNDVIEGNGGDDVALGGVGNDIITDLDGADVLKGGPGNDAADAGPGDDIMMGADGSDFLNGGANDNEEFAGPGNDFVIAGQGADAVFGDGGDDWIEGGTGQDLLQGDHGAPFFDDPAETAPGNDIFVGQEGENDYDAEGGDDLMSQNAAVDRNAGAAGFDWAFHQYDTVGADDDMKINQQLIGLPIQLVVNRDRWQETEADSGSRFNDVIRGDDQERVVGPGGFSGCDALDPTGVARISGLSKLVTTFPTSLADVVDASAMGRCPLVGSGGTAGDPRSGTVWAEGNILLGGAGSDVIEGRGNDDIIDGDHAVNVRISVLGDADNNAGTPLTEIGSTDLMEHAARSGNFGPGSTPTMTLQQAVFAGIVDPGNLVSVREILGTSGEPMGATPKVATAGDCTFAAGSTSTTVSAGSTNCDTALFTGEIVDPANIAASYSITLNPNGSVTVADLASVAAGPPFPKGDGIADTLWNIENLRFCTAIDPNKNCSAFVNLPAPGAVGPAAPGVTLSAASVALANTAVRAASAAQTITVTNTGTAPLTITGTPLSGTNPGDFTATGCVGTIAPGGTCTISVTFAPLTTAGAKSATLTINSNAAGAAKTVALTGTATPDVTRPTLTATTPVANATAVAAASLIAASVPGITVTFNEPISAASVVASGAAPTVTVRVGATVIPITAALDASGKVLKISPTAALANDTRYTVRLTNGIRDLTNNALVATNWTFLTGLAPTVIAQTPADGATQVSPTANITATFSEPMVAAGITAAGSATVALANGGPALPAAVTYQAGTTRTVTVNPTADLTPNTAYKVTLTGGTAAIRDQAGNPLVTTTWTFTTGDLATVTARAPGVGATGVPRSVSVTATFSEAMNAATISGASVTLRRGTGAGGALQAAAVTFNAGTNTLTLDPSVNLAANGVYTVRLVPTPAAATILDAEGTPINAVTWSFTTGATL